MIRGIEIKELNDFRDEDGSLVVIENLKSVIPFNIKRFFYIFNVNKNTTRGKHANINSKFFMICLNGTCDIVVDNGIKKEIITLKSPLEGLYLDKMIWKDMCNFSSDAVLLVLSSELYDANEYIRDYDKFLLEIKNKNI